MKVLKTKRYVFAGLIFFIGTYIIIRYTDDVKSNFYELNNDIFLEKVDYFSKYNIVQKKELDYTTLITDVEAISQIHNSFLISFDKGNETNYLYLSKNTSKYYIYDNLKDLENNVSIKNLEWKKPWQFVENKTLNNSKKLTSQIALIIIIVLLIYLIMSIFNIKKLFQSSKKKRTGIRRM